MAEGTYIRVGATSRPADEIKIKELQLQGQHISFDHLIYRGMMLEEQDIAMLCDEMNACRNRYIKRKDMTKELQLVTKQNLINWGLLLKEYDTYFPSNGFMICIGKGFPFAKIQCARFKGTDRSVFIDRKEYHGSIFHQLESTYNFILDHIHLSARFEGLIRMDEYEIPTTVLRECILNALNHRSYMLNACIQVSIYDDRLEITSPGSLYGGLTMEQAIAGNSMTRNTIIAEVLSQSMLIESWGTGLQRIIEGCREHGLADPIFESSNTNFRVTIIRNQNGEHKVSENSVISKGNVVKNVTHNVTESLLLNKNVTHNVTENTLSSENVTHNVTENALSSRNVTHNVTENVTHNVTENKKEIRKEKILEFIKENEEITLEELASKCNVTIRTIKRDITDLKNQKRLQRQISPTMIRSIRKNQKREIRKKQILTLIRENNDISTEELAVKCNVTLRTIKRDINELKIEQKLNRQGENWGKWLLP